MIDIILSCIAIIVGVFGVIAFLYMGFSLYEDYKKSEEQIMIELYLIIGLVVGFLGHIHFANGVAEMLNPISIVTDIIIGCLFWPLALYGMKS